MSYDLCVWHETRPITVKEADAIDRRLCEGDLSAARPHANVKKFFDELTRRYPDIDSWNEEELEDCPWSGGFEQSDRHVSMLISFSRVDEIVPLVLQLADKFDLVCYDPQAPCVTYPTSVARIPHLRLCFEDWSLVDNPTDLQIADRLSALNAEGNSFAILERTDTVYLQVRLLRTGQYVIEYQEGSLDRHYQAFSSDVASIIQAFQAYAAESDSWRTQFEWKRIVL